MPQFSEYAPGQFCWVDLMSRSLDGACKFYCGLFGWDAEAQDSDGGHPYVCFKLGEHQVGGLGEMNAEMKAGGMPPVWNSYVAVDDLDACVQQVAELGGGVLMPPLKVSEAGRMAVVSDPAGAAFSLWQKLHHCGAGVANEPGSWCWNELMSRDPESAREFYGQLFGWTFARDESNQNEYWMIHLGERMNGGMLRLTEEMSPDAPSHWAVYFSVADLDASLAQLQQLGGRVVHGPFEVSVGKIGVVSDDDGAFFQLIQMCVPEDEP